MPKFVFSSDQIPAHGDEQVRRRMWRNLHAEHFGSCEMEYAADRPLSVRYELLRFGEVGVTRQIATGTFYARSAPDVAADPRGDFHLGFNCAQSPPTLFQRNNELTLALQQPVLYSNADPIEVRAARDMALIGVCVPRARLLERLAYANDRVIEPLDRSSPAASLLRRYLAFLLEPDEIESDPAVDMHIETTLVDLVALTLGARGDAAEIAGMRGLRAARIQAIVAEIRSGFSDPTFSVERVARKLGLATRYVQNLLHESGLSFTSRVMELRLQRARAMLVDPAYNHQKISEIALACGFYEPSYFDRAFRRRFGDKPGSFRRR